MIIAAFILLLLNPVLVFPWGLHLFFLYRKTFICTLLFASACGYIAFAAETSDYGDIARYIDITIKSRDYSIFETVDSYYDGLYILNAMFWICGQMFDPRTFVFFTAFIVYGVIFYILLDYSKERKAQNSNIFLLFIISVFFIPFFAIISSARSSMALMIGILGLYLDFVKKEKPTKIIILYLAPLFIHKASIVIIAIRLILYIPKHIRGFVLFITSICILLMGLGSFNFLEHYSFGNESYLSDTLETFSGYSAFGEAQYSDWQTGFRYTRFNIITKVLYFVPFFNIMIQKVDLHDQLNEDILSITKVASFLIIPLMFYPTNPYLRYVSTFSVLLAISQYIIYQKRAIIFVLFNATLCLYMQIHAFNQSIILDEFYKKMMLGVFYYL